MDWKIAKIILSVCRKAHTCTDRLARGKIQKHCQLTLNELLFEQQKSSIGIIESIVLLRAFRNDTDRRHVVGRLSLGEE